MKLPKPHLLSGASWWDLPLLQKNGGTNSNGNPNILKTYIEDAWANGIHQIDTFAVTYDNDNRLTGLVSPALKFLYTYSSKSYTLDLYESCSAINRPAPTPGRSARR